MSQGSDASVLLLLFFPYTVHSFKNYVLASLGLQSMKTQIQLLY